MRLNHYGVDPIFTNTLPSFACDAMLKFTGVETGLVCDQDMYEMMDAGLRGMTQTT